MTGPIGDKKHEGQPGKHPLTSCPLATQENAEQVAGSP